MSQIWKPLTKATYKDWIDAIIGEASDELTDWETGFIHSLEHQLTFKDLTESQAVILERIYASKTK